MFEQSAYARAGVDIAAGQRATELMKEAVRASQGPEVLAGIGAFGGLYDAGALSSVERPVLVASTDGVGTKTMVAARLGRWDTIGRDLVNHCVNDILVQGARPLFFLDYVASADLEPETVATVVRGMAEACGEAGCALLGGETAEMPGVYHPGAMDVVGTIVGVVARQRLVDGSRIEAGDLLLGLPASGLHTNGYTLARAALAGLDWEEPHPALAGRTPGAALLDVHRSYLRPVRMLWEAGVDIRGMAHITGGGLIDNPPRIFPAGLGAVLRRESWPVPPIFSLIRRLGDVPQAEMAHVFNMGLGMVVVLPPADLVRARATLPADSYVVGEMVEGEGVTIV